MKFWAVNNAVGGAPLLQIAHTAPADAAGVLIPETTRPVPMSRPAARHRVEVTASAFCGREDGVLVAQEGDATMAAGDQVLGRQERAASMVAAHDIDVGEVVSLQVEQHHRCATPDLGGDHGVVVP